MSKDDIPVEDGLIFGFALDGSGGGQRLTWQDVSNLPTDSSSIWLHLDFIDGHSRKWLRQKSGVDHMIVNAMLDEDSRPRMVEHETGLLIILRGVNSNPGADPEDMVSIRVWLESNRIISTRRRKLMSAQSLHDTLMEGTGPKNSGDFLVKLAEKLRERIEPAVEGLDADIEQAETKFEGDKSSGYGGEFSNLRRQSARIRRYLAPQRDALERLSRLSNKILTDDQYEALREEANQITRILEDLDLVRERAMVAQEELLAHLANEQNRRMYILSLVAAIFLPLSFLTGLMGMNVAGLPGTESSWAFLILSILMAGVAIGIVGLFKLQKWL